MMMDYRLHDHVRYPLLGLLGALALAGNARSADAVEVAIACGAGGDVDYCPTAARAWADDTGHSVASLRVAGPSSLLRWRHVLYA